MEYITDNYGIYYRLLRNINAIIMDFNGELISKKA